MADLNNKGEISEKPGGAGKQEAYSVETGKYVAESGISDQEIIDEINKGANGFFGQEAKDTYDSLKTEEEKKALIDQIQEIIRNQNTERNIKNTNFQELSPDDYDNMLNNCDKVYANEIEAKNWLYNKYCGGGYQQFEFNKFLRMGEEAYKQTETYKGLSPVSSGGWGPWASIENFEKLRDEMDKLTDGRYSAEKDFRGERYLNSNYIVSQFADYLGFDDYVEDSFTNKRGLTSKSGYKTIDFSKHSMKEVYEKLLQAVGDMVPLDGGFTSFSMVSRQSHMNSPHSMAQANTNRNKFKEIQISYDIPKGTPMFVTGNRAESEAIFGRKTSYYIKDVKLISIDDGTGNQRERIQLIYGVK